MMLSSFVDLILWCVRELSSFGTNNEPYVSRETNHKLHQPPILTVTLLAWMTELLEVPRAVNAI